MIIRIILHINDREEGSLIISKLILIVLITLKWFCQPLGVVERRCLFKDQENTSCPWAQTSHCPLESCNTGIKLTKSLILKLILKLQLRSIDIKFGQSPLGYGRPTGALHQSVSVRLGNEGRGDFILLFISVI